MIKNAIFLLTIAALLLAVSCSSKNNSGPDTGGDDDGSGTDELTPDPDKALPEKDVLPDVEGTPDSDGIDPDDMAVDDDETAPDEAVDGADEAVDQSIPDETADESVDTFVPDETTDTAVDQTIPDDDVAAPDGADENVSDDQPDQSDQTDQSDQSSDVTVDDTADADVTPVDIDTVVTCEDDGVTCTTELIVGGQCRHIAQHDECGLGELCDQTEGCRSAAGWACIACPNGVQDCAHPATDICATIRITADPVCLIPCTFQSECGAGYTCAEVFDEYDQSLGYGCVPDNNVCCMNFDGDSSGIGADCSSQDCDESDPAVYPGALEECNGLDDNCVDGVDEGVVGPYCEDQDGACFGARHSCDGLNGWAVCTETEYASSADWQAVESWCDSIDNDCNGQIDEPFAAQLYKVCSAGIGVCLSNGVMLCAADKLSVVCGATPKTAPESPDELTCDNKDNNCDGQVDEPWNRNVGCAANCKGDLCYVGDGVCRATGVRICSGGGTVCSATEGIPDPSDLTGGGVENKCDDIDNDCDGEADQPWNRHNGTCDNPNGCKNEVCYAGVGACRTAGILVCNALKDDVECNAVEGIPADSEFCNNLDDNCNGTVDEGFAAKNQPCTVGIGECRKNGVTICASDQLSVVCGAVPGDPAAELCDGLDNNCVGGVDEPWPLKNTPCSNGLAGACERTGIYVCKSDKSDIECNAPTVNGTPEQCDGIDNNCAGGVDETWPDKNTACTNGQVGACERAGIYVCNAAKTGIECNAPTINTAGLTESCNGIDDDCDGLTDETWSDKNTACSNGQVGACERAGIYVCNGAQTGIECNAPTINTAGLTESCNGIDDDCDGLTDETWSDKNTACTNGQVGACERPGIYVCNGAQNGIECNAPMINTAGLTESCNGIDDDCDGLTDETWPDKNTVCSNGQAGACERPGIYVCNGAQNDIVCNAPLINTAGLTESCNGIDDDCDGLTDETWPNKNTACTNGQVGACERTGMYVCNGAQTGIVCNAPLIDNAGFTETCNGIDDDCNGAVDDHWTRHDGTCDNTNGCKSDVCYDGVGACREAGILVCNDDEDDVECNAVAGIPAGGDPCNGLDDNCNGEVDEAYAADKGKACSVGDGECRRNGITVCNVEGTGVICNATEGSPTAELCDGLDNNCAGGIDELWSDKNTVCSNGLAGACERPGIYICNGAKDGLVCNAPIVGGTPEQCDGIDNNCAGGVDETWPLKGTACSNGLAGACARSGVYVCNGAKTDIECNAPTASGTPEVCDGIDNDCAGGVDNGLTGDPCANQTGVCAGTRQSCGGTAGWLACGPTQYAANANGTYEQNETICDGKDNDCDGSVDENVASYAELCPLQSGVCKDSRKTCGGASGWLACTAENYGGSYVADENSCDYLDNDCDGTVDEGYLNGGKYTLDTACGDCSTNCAVIYQKDNATGTCNSTGAPVCQLSCTAGFFNLNQIPDDGCEFELLSTVIYVSTTNGTDDATCGNGPIGTGAGNHPCKTISYGLTRAYNTTRAQVRVADGLYEETVELRNGISLYGGYKADSWEEHVPSTLTMVRGTTTLYDPHRVTIIASGITDTTEVKGFVIYGPDAGIPSGNSYAIYITGSNASLALRNNIIYGGAGGPGGDGGAGVSGTVGGNGVGRTSDPAGYDAKNAGDTDGTHSECTAATRQYSNGAASSCGGAGGNGGGNTCSPVNDTPTSGAAGATGAGTGGGAGGIAGYDMTNGYTSSDGAFCNEFSLSSSKNGANGANGNSGAEGAAGVGGSFVNGGIVSIHWSGATGAKGGNGATGAGGGGGGAGGGANSTNSNNDYDDTFGGHGGGGGAGGCGATGATGGTAGGGSFAIFIIHSEAPTLEDNKIFIGAGGNGGKGGNGGGGGAGGNGGDGGLSGVSFPTACSGNGGKGGKGGRGGHGGGGGGGAGGVAFGIALYDVAGSPSYEADNTFSGGAGGNGGAGGASFGNTGTAGVTGGEANVFAFGSALCGNGQQDAGEECDLAGDNNDCSTCSSTCHLRAANVCGDGYTCGTEECDDANTNQDDGCFNNCKNGYRPIGAQAVNPNKTAITGWSCDQDNWSGAVTVLLNFGYWNGSAYAYHSGVTVTANLSSDAGVQASCGGTDNHNFTYDATAKVAEMESGGYGKPYIVWSYGYDAVVGPVGSPYWYEWNPLQNFGQVMVFCGNSIIEAGEVCDDGNTDDNDTCRNDCTRRCEADWWYHNGHCYQYVSGAQAYTTAATDCNGKGAYLAAIATAAENSFVTSLAPSTSVWLGLAETYSTAVSGNNSAATAFVTGKYGGQYTGATTSGNPMNYYKITPLNNGRYSFYLRGLSVDLDLYLYQSNCTTQITSSAAGGTADESIFRDLTGGTTYCVRVGYSTNASSYTLTLNYVGGDEHQYKHWITSEPYDYANWALNEPNNDNEDCTEKVADGTWNDITCTGSRAYVCEKVAP
ncbi:MAG TPA: MopE-related protein [bacterium]|nr:MopE-related protein [bacterium]